MFLSDPWQCVIEHQGPSSGSGDTKRVQEQEQTDTNVKEEYYQENLFLPTNCKLGEGWKFVPQNVY